MYEYEKDIPWKKKSHRVPILHNDLDLELIFRFGYAFARYRTQFSTIMTTAPIKNEDSRHTLVGRQLIVGQKRGVYKRPCSRPAHGPGVRIPARQCSSSSCHLAMDRGKEAATRQACMVLACPRCPWCKSKSGQACTSKRCGCGAVRGGPQCSTHRDHYYLSRRAHNKRRHVSTSIPVHLVEMFDKQFVATKSQCSAWPTRTSDAIPSKSSCDVLPPYSQPNKCQMVFPRASTHW